MNATPFCGSGLCERRSRTKIPGIGLANVSIRGRKQLHVTAHCGRVTKKFNIKRLGRAAALRAALRVRAQYEGAKT